MEAHLIAVVINYCSNEYKFLKPCIEAVKEFSDKIYIPISDHFFDGTEENKNHLYCIFEKFPEVNFILYPYIPEQIPPSFYKRRGKKGIWHSIARMAALKFLPKSTEYVLFLDVDEIMDGKNFKKWIDTLDYNQYDVINFANYWYFRSAEHQATTLESSALLVKRKLLSLKKVVQTEERTGLYNKIKGKKRPMVLGPDDKPMVHHYSWVRTKEEMLKKVGAWGHKNDRDWAAQVEMEFTKPFQGKDFVHGYDFLKVEPFVKINLDDPLCIVENQEIKSFFNVKYLKPKELLRILKIIKVDFSWPFNLLKARHSFSCVKKLDLNE